MTVAKLQSLVAPRMANSSALGINVEPVYGEYGQLLWCMVKRVPPGVDRPADRKDGHSPHTHRQFNQTIRNRKTLGLHCSIFDKGGGYVGFGITGGPGPYPDNAVDSAWRGAAMHLILWIEWGERRIFRKDC
ncbi:FAD binding domain-containing protein [Seiridium cupressi]